MKKTKMTRSLLAACSIVALSAVMYGCVHGGGDGPSVSMLDLMGVDTPAGATVEAGTYDIDDVPTALATALEDYTGPTMAAAGGTITVGDYVFSCSDAGPCSVTVAPDGSHFTTTGTINVAMAMDTVDPVDPEPTGPTVADLFTTAQTSNTGAMAAGTATSDGVKAAMEAAGKLGLLSSEGESMTEYNNAMDVLNAQQAVLDAVDDAQEALDNANTAKTHAEALDDSAQKTALIAALGTAIEAAEQALEDAEKARDGNDLKTAVDSVTGGEDADPKGTPGSLARAVAMAVGEALGGMTTDDGIPTAAAGNGLADTDVPDGIATTAAGIPDMTVKGVTRKKSAKGMTWGMVVGDDNIMMERIGGNNAALPVTSIAGLDASAVDKTGTALASNGGTNNDGKYPDAIAQGSATVTGTPGTEHMGIPGAVWCLSADGCSVSADGKLSDGWQFTPTEATTLYVKRKDDPDTPANESLLYMAEVMYVQYGYWLTHGDRDQATDTDASNDAAALNRYAVLSGSGPNTANLNYLAATGESSATYNGDAIGMSVHKEVDTDGEITSIDSGSFTAGVALELRFGDGLDVTLGGTIDNFQGNAIDPDDKWTVELERRVFTADGTADGAQGSFTEGKTVASGRNGIWSAQAYGPAQVDNVNQRPTGVFGAFNAHFSDGHAAGVYAAD